MSHRELFETSDITVEDAVMYHAKMFCYVVSGLHEALQQGQTQMETLTNVQVTMDHVFNAVQSTQKQFATHLQ